MIVSHPHCWHCERETVVVEGDEPLLPVGASPAGEAHVEGYAGIQKVHDSNNSFTLELAIVDRWARIGGQLTQFSEDQGAGMPALTLTMPAFTIGIRVDGGMRDTRAYLEGGVVGAKTNHDPTMNTSWVGGLGGVRLEEQVAPHTQLVGTAQLMVFEDNVRAGELSAGLRVGPLQASLRVVDFNVGPALWGPEVGLKF